LIFWKLFGLYVVVVTSNHSLRNGVYSVFAGTSEAYGIYGGIPAKMLRKVDHEEA